MTKKERVLAAISHKNPDKIPKGELAIESGLRDELLSDKKYKGLSTLAKELAVRELLGFDLINIHEFPAVLIGYGADGYPIYRSPYGDEYKDTGISFQMLKPALADIEKVK